VGYRSRRICAALDLPYNDTPSLVFGIKARAEIGPSYPLNGGDERRVFIRRFLRIIAGNPAEYVRCAEEGQKRLWPGLSR
jgi:hypothetical protein